MLPSLFDPTFLMAVLQIVMIDILLGGDNAVVIALACRRLPEELRRKGIFWGVLGAIVVRILLIFFALQLLALPFLKLVGAALLLWIGIRLLAPTEEAGHEEMKTSSHLLGAIKTIIIADVVMSLDNVIAVAGAARGDLWLVVFGILVSVPIIVWGSQWVLRLMDRFPWVISAGGALLGWIAGEMAVSDIVIAPMMAHEGVPRVIHYAAAASGALAVVLIGKWLAARGKAASDAKSATRSLDASESTSDSSKS